MKQKNDILKSQLFDEYRDDVFRRWFEIRSEINKLLKEVCGVGVTGGKTKFEIALEKELKINKEKHMARLYDESLKIEEK